MYEFQNYTLIFPGETIFSHKRAETMIHMLTLMNTAIDALPKLEPCGWHNLPECDDNCKPISGTTWNVNQG